MKAHNEAYPPEEHGVKNSKGKNDFGQLLGHYYE